MPVCAFKGRRLCKSYVTASRELHPTPKNFTLCIEEYHCVCCMSIYYFYHSVGLRFCDYLFFGFAISAFTIFRFYYFSFLLFPFLLFLFLLFLFLLFLVFTISHFPFFLIILLAFYQNAICALPATAQRCMHTLRCPRTAPIRGILPWGDAEGSSSRPLDCLLPAPA